MTTEHGASLASGQGIAAALEPCATCGAAEDSYIHGGPVGHAYVAAQPKPDCAKCGQAEQSLNHVRCIYRVHDGICPAPERHHAYVAAQPREEPPSDEARLARFRAECATLPATRPPVGSCEDCGGPAWKPLLVCAACYPKRVARAMLRQRAEQARWWNHADGCAEEADGKYACDCGLWEYREEAKAKADD